MCVHPVRTSELCLSYSARPNAVVQGKSHTLDIVKESHCGGARSGMARAIEGFHSFTCIPTRLSKNGINHAYPAFPAEAGPHLPTSTDRRLSWPMHHKGK